MPAPVYSPLGERVYQLLLSEIAAPTWSTDGPFRLKCGPDLGFLLMGGPDTVRVELRRQTFEQDVAMSAVLTDDDHARLAPLVRAGIQKLISTVHVKSVDDALRGVALGPARDPARAKLTEQAVAMARLILKAAESDSVGESEVRQFLDKIREDLDG